MTRTSKTTRFGLSSSLRQATGSAGCRRVVNWSRNHCLVSSSRWTVPSPRTDSIRRPGSPLPALETTIEQCGSRSRPLTW